MMMMMMMMMIITCRLTTKKNSGLLHSAYFCTVPTKLACRRRIDIGSFLFYLFFLFMCTYSFILNIDDYL